MATDQSQKVEAAVALLQIIDQHRHDCLADPDIVPVFIDEQLWERADYIRSQLDSRVLDG